MADISAQPFINYGASIAGQENTSANTGLARAQTDVAGQQAQAAAMQNRILAARMPFIMKMYDQMGAQSDASGVEGHGEGGGPLQAKEDSIKENGYDPEKITQSNAEQYLVKEWTPQEQQNTQMAAASGDPAAIQYYAMQRQQRLDTQRQLAAYRASNQYSKYAAASNAPSAYEFLKQADPQYTRWLDRHADEQEQQGNPIDKEKAATNYAKYQAADLHRHTGRPLDFKNDQAVDKDTGLPVAGVPRMQMSAKDQAEFMKDAQSPSIEVQTGRPGQTKKIPPWKAAGYSSPHAYLNAVEEGSAPTPDALNQLTAGKTLTASQLADLQHPRRAAATAGAAAPSQQNPVATAPGGQVPNQGATQPAPGSQAAQPSPPAASTPGAAPAQPNAPIKGNETLSDVDTNKLPKYAPPQNAPNTSATTEQGLDIQAHNKEKYTQMGLANQQLQKNATERGLLDQAQVEINSLRANPRAVGPGSAVTTAWNEFKSYATGKTPDPLTERKLFDKVLLQLGAQNVKAAFDNQSRIGQQEYMKLLTEGNPTGGMPLDAIQKLVDFSRYNNEFSTRSNNTKLDALNKGADPYSRQFNNLDQGRAAYVQSRMNPQQQGPKYSNEQVKAYMHEHDLTDEKAVRKALGL